MSRIHVVTKSISSRAPGNTRLEEYEDDHYYFDPATGVVTRERVKSWDKAPEDGGPLQKGSSVVKTETVDLKDAPSEVRTYVAGLGQ